MTNTITQTGAITSLVELLSELASELDLHYEDADLFALSPTIETMKNAAMYVVASGLELPGSYTHLLSRFNRNYH